MVGQSPAMREIFGLIERIAPTNATMLIEGETGTGRGMIARTLRPAAAGDLPFIVVDCRRGRRQLFGHDEHYTGAVAARQGAFELSANGGRVFLNELGELSLNLHRETIRVLEQRELRESAAPTIKVDLRMSNANIRSEVDKGKFREDLYFQLNVVAITAPSLRESVAKTSSC